MDTLSKTQLAVLTALLQCKTATEAARAAGCNEKTVRRYLADPVFLAALREQQAAMLAGVRAAIVSGAETAITVLREVLSSGGDEGLRARTAQFWLTHLQKTIETDELLARLEVLEAQIKP